MSTTTPELNTIGDVERLNSGTGHHFFSPGAMRFFKSRIDGNLLYGRYFVTTEKRESEARRATLRIAMDDGSIETAGEFQQFANPAAARKALEKGRRSVEVRHDPYEDVREPLREDGFNWRCYLGELPIGSKTTWRDAYAVAEQLGYVDTFDYEPWRHGGWYVLGVQHKGGGTACVSRQMLNPKTGKADRKWRIVCDSREGDYTYRTRDEAARAERDMTAGAFDRETVNA